MRALIVGLLAVSVGCTALPTPAPSGPEVPVTFRPSRPDATLQQSILFEEWRTICLGPCDTRVRPDRLYRVSGEDVTTSRSFALPAPAVVTARAGSSGMRTTGAMLMLVGIPLSIFGSFYALGNAGGGHGMSGDSDAVAAGLAMFFGGIGMTIGGSFLMHAHVTEVYMRDAPRVAKLTFRF